MNEWRYVSGGGRVREMEVVRNERVEWEDGEEE